MKFVRAILIVAAAVGSATVSHAQLGSGRSGSSTTQYFGNDVAMNALQAFGGCFARTNPDGAARLIATVPGSKEEATVYRALFRGETPCLGDISSMQVSPQLVRGSIAEGLYRRRVALSDTLRQAPIEQKDVRNLSDAARCYVGKDFATAQSLMTQPLGSKGEFAAVTGLLPEFAKCLPAGVEARFPYTLVRLRIAEALYRTGAVRPQTVQAD